MWIHRFAVPPGAERDERFVEHGTGRHAVFQREWAAQHQGQQLPRPPAEIPGAVATRS